MLEQKENRNVLIPRLDVTIPASLYINGRQVPPIECSAVITRFGCSSLSIASDRRIPIPSKGLLRFSFESGERGRFELSVNFVGCIEQARNFWSWRSKPVFEMQVCLDNVAPETMQRYLYYINQVTLGNKPAHVEIVRAKEEEMAF